MTTRNALARHTLAAFLAVLLVAPPAFADRTRLKPGWNMYSEKQDIELGAHAAREAEQQLSLLNDRRVDDYLSRLGRRLVKVTPGYQYPYQFKAVNDKSINAFALPGGFMYVNRGLFEAADNEAQLAGVMAHEISHVALRHGTNQLTKATVAQAPLAILGGVFGGGGSLVGQLTQLGVAVGFTSVFLKFSRSAETQADVLGTQILYDAGYDPTAMADFFDILNQQSKGGRPPEFFSSHPSPKNRRKRINQEIEKLGGVPERARRDSDEFHAIKQIVSRAPQPSKRRTSSRGAAEPDLQRPPAPARRLHSYRHREFRISYPENWQVQEGNDVVLLAPEGGYAQGSIAYGVLTGIRHTHESLEQETERLIDELLQQNRGMRHLSTNRARLGGRRAFATRLEAPSPLGGRETDWLFTAQTRNGVFYAVFIVPESDYRNYRSTFERMTDSIRFQ